MIFYLREDSIFRVPIYLFLWIMLKFKAMVDWSTLTKVIELRSYLNFVNYPCRFIKSINGEMKRSGHTRLEMAAGWVPLCKT